MKYYHNRFQGLLYGGVIIFLMWLAIKLANMVGN
jgi:hypothetical protein